MNPPREIAKRVEVMPDGCWRWCGPVTKGGYALSSVAGKVQLIHRYMFRTYCGEIAAGRVVGHTCHDADLKCPGGDTCLHRRCVNPAHLASMTQRENLLASRHTMLSRKTCTHTATGPSCFACENKKRRARRRAAAGAA